MDGVVIISFIVVVLIGFTLYSFWTNMIAERSPRVSKEALRRQKERSLDGLVELEREFRRGAISRTQYLSRRARLRQRAESTAQRISEAVLKSRESLGLIIDTEGRVKRL